MDPERFRDDEKEVMAAKSMDPVPDWESNDFKKKVGDCIYDYSIGLDPQLRKGVHSERN